ncbi:MAG: hypothetical protein M1505_00685 [Patescibacteria group bacterium]|nr:hypothetical protein [Patescibacteria group bacterium]
MLRTAEFLKVKKVYLVGITPNQNHPSVAKTSLKAENNIEISEAKYLKPLLLSLKRSGFKLVAIEQAKNSIPYFKFKPKQNQKIVLIVGNEKTGLKAR